MPHARYLLSGQVTEAEGDHAPIEGILIETAEAETRTDSLGEWSLDYIAMETYSGLGAGEDTLYVIDTDSTENGGAFHSHTLVLDLTKIASGDGRWDNGTYRQEDIMVQLISAGVGKVGE